MPETYIPIEVVVAEYERWTAGARTGRITLEFHNGRCAVMERADRLAMPIDRDPPLVLPVSPCCASPMAWYDYDTIGTCPPPCGKVWNIFEARREMSKARNGKA